jgi:hypothetical protein
MSNYSRMERRCRAHVRELQRLRPHADVSR